VKKMFCLFLTFALLCGALCACGAPSEPDNANTIKIPDVEKLDIDTAKTLLAGKGLIPKVEYEYNNDYDYDLVIRTEPAIGSEVEEDTPVTLYVCKGPSYYELPSSLATIYDIDGIEPFVPWVEANDGKGTKAHQKVWVENGYLYISMYIGCKSKYSVEFYGDFGDASINDSFDKTVPIDVIYSSKTIDKTYNIQVIGYAEISAQLVLLNICRIDCNNNFNLFLKLEKHFKFAVRLKAGQHA